MPLVSSAVPLSSSAHQAVQASRAGAEGPSCRGEILRDTITQLWPHRRLFPESWHHSAFHWKGRVCPGNRCGRICPRGLSPPVPPSAWHGPEHVGPALPNKGVTSIDTPHYQCSNSDIPREPNRGYSSRNVSDFYSVWLLRARRSST